MNSLPSSLVSHLDCACRCVRCLHINLKEQQILQLLTILCSGRDVHSIFLKSLKALTNSVTEKMLDEMEKDKISGSDGDSMKMIIGTLCWTLSIV
jgi:hypothetical protein